jgi:hypothetical protein
MKILVPNSHTAVINFHDHFSSVCEALGVRSGNTPPFSNFPFVALLVRDTPPTRMHVRPPVLAQASTYVSVCMGVSAQGNGAENEGPADESLTSNVIWQWVSCGVILQFMSTNLNHSSPVHLNPFASRPTAKPRTSAPILRPPPPPRCCRSALQCVSNPARDVWICRGIVPLSRAVHLSHFSALRT